MGIDTNTFYLALTVVKNGQYDESLLLPHDGPERRDDHPKLKTNRNKKFENRSARERLDVMADMLDAYLSHPMEAVVPHYVYIEEPPYVNSIKTFAELTAVVMVVRETFRRRGVPVVIVNVQTWKRETTGNAKADKTEVKQWAMVHAGMPDDLTEDEYDAGCVAFRGAVASGDVRKAS
jgi:Holliday junction resolvasome RuvABC endonuclease subunit